MVSILFAWNIPQNPSLKAAGGRIRPFSLKTRKISSFFSRKFSLKNLFYNLNLYYIMNRKEALKILNLKDSGTLTTTKIKKTYYAMALKLHPDKGGDEEEFKKINAAYTLLTKPSISSRSSISSISRSMSRSSSRKSKSPSPSPPSPPPSLWQVASLIAFAAVLEGVRMNFLSRTRKGGVTRRSQKRKTRKRH